MLKRNVARVPVLNLLLRDLDLDQQAPKVATNQQLAISRQLATSQALVINLVLAIDLDEVDRVLIARRAVLSLALTVLLHAVGHQRAVDRVREVIDPLQTVQHTVKSPVLTVPHREVGRCRAVIDLHHTALHAVLSQAQLALLHEVAGQPGVDRVLTVIDLLQTALLAVISLDLIDRAQTVLQEVTGPRQIVQHAVTNRDLPAPQRPVVNQDQLAQKRTVINQDQLALLRAVVDQPLLLAVINLMLVPGPVSQAHVVLRLTRPLLVGVEAVQTLINCQGTRNHVQLDMNESLLITRRGHVSSRLEVSS